MTPSLPPLAAPRSRINTSRARHLAFAAAVLATALTHLPGSAQPADAAGPTPQAAGAQPTRLPDDFKAFISQPRGWGRRGWLRFGGIVAAVGVAYSYDDKVRAHFANDGDPDYHEVLDTMPAAFTFGGMWFAAKLAHNDEAAWEVAAMRRAIVIQTISTEIVKVGLRRERPGPGVPRDHWNDGGLSFPSGHTATAFAIGTVLAESGDDRHRLLRRIAGYGIGVLTGYERLNHDAHWLSDVVGGAAIGIATAKFVMKRREGTKPRGEISLLPLEGGAMLTYTMPIR
jgi:PAP2 superfamily